ncbi:MAG TPA: DUF58 domain-containing protein [Humisphaera sp.]
MTAIPHDTVDYRKYLDPRVLARVHSLELRARLVIEGVMTGMHRSPYQGISVEFAQHRQYVSGDDVRHVDWKVFGKTDKIYLKQYLQETNLQLVSVVDASESMAYSSVSSGKDTWSKFDCATSIAAALSYMVIQQQDSAALAVFDQDLKQFVKPSNSPAQWKIITHELAVTPKLRKTNTGRILDQLAEKLNHRSVVLLISDFFDDVEQLKKGLRHLRYKKHEVICMQVLDPAEITFPFEDTTLFRGLEQAGELLAEPRALRQAYIEQLNLHTAELQKMCRGMHVDFVRIDSGAPLDVALSGFLATRQASIKIK